MLDQIKTHTKKMLILVAIIVSSLTGNISQAQIKEASNLGLRNSKSLVQVDVNDKRIRNIKKYFANADSILNKFDLILEGEKDIREHMEIKFLHKEAKDIILQINLALAVRKNIDSAFSEISKLKDEELRKSYSESALYLIKYCDELITYVTSYEMAKFYFSLIETPKDHKKFDWMIWSSWPKLDKEIKNQLFLLKQNGLNSAFRSLTDLWVKLVYDMEAIKKGNPPSHQKFFYKFY